MNAEFTISSTPRHRRLDGLRHSKVGLGFARLCWQGHASRSSTVYPYWPGVWFPRYVRQVEPIGNLRLWRRPLGIMHTGSPATISSARGNC